MQRNQSAGSAAQTARGSRGGALPAEVGARLEYEVRLALGALPGVTLHRNAQIRATTPTGAAILTGLGGKGAPDLMAEVRTPGGITACVWLECKAGTGELNPSQKLWHEAARREGRHVFVIRDAADALAIVRTFQAGAPVEALERKVAELTRERDGLLDVLAKSTREVTDLRGQVVGVVS